MATTRKEPMMVDVQKEYVIDITTVNRDWNRPLQADNGQWVNAVYCHMEVRRETLGGELCVELAMYDGTDYYVVEEAVIVDEQNQILAYVPPRNIKVVFSDEPRRAIPARCRVSDLAKMTGYQRAYIKAEITEGRLAAVKDERGEYFIHHSDVAAWLANPRRGTRSARADGARSEEG